MAFQFTPEAIRNQFASSIVTGNVTPAPGQTVPGIVQALELTPQDLQAAAVRVQERAARAGGEGLIGTINPLLSAVPYFGGAWAAVNAAGNREAAQSAQTAASFIDALQRARVPTSSMISSAVSAIPSLTSGAGSPPPLQGFGVTSPISLDRLIAQIRGHSMLGPLSGIFSNSRGLSTISRKRVRRMWSWGVMT